LRKKTREWSAAVANPRRRKADYRQREREREREIRGLAVFAECLPGAPMVIFAVLTVF